MPQVWKAEDAERVLQAVKEQRRTEYDVQGLLQGVQPGKQDD
jgi:hypothetical protein